MSMMDIFSLFLIKVTAAEAARDICALYRHDFLTDKMVQNGFPVSRRRKIELPSSPNSDRPAHFDENHAMIKKEPVIGLEYCKL